MGRAETSPQCSMLVMSMTHSSLLHGEMVQGLPGSWTLPTTSMARGFPWGLFGAAVILGIVSMLAP